MTIKDRVFTGLIAAVTFIAFLPQFVSSKIIAWLDMMFYFLPFRVLPAELLRNHVLPLWNPYVYCGQPLMANMQSAVLYPPDMLFYVLEPALAVKLLTFMAFFLMAFFMYMFMRLHKVSEEGSLLSAFLLAFTYYMTVKAVELADLHVMVWMPAVLYFVKKFAVKGRAVDLFFISATLAMSFLGGHAQVFMYVYLLFTAYYFFETWASGKKGSILSFVMLNAVFGAIVLAQALPTAEFIMHSKRMAPGGMGYEASVGGFMKLEHLVEMVFPFISAFLPKGTSFLNWVGLVDIGILALFLSALGAAKITDNRYRLFLVSAFTASFFISFMGSLPFYRFLWENIPLLQMMRYPAKINLIFFFSLCALSGHGFDLLFGLAEEKLKGFTRFVLASGAAVFVLYAGLEAFKTPMLKYYKKFFAPVIKIEDFIDKVLVYDSFLKSLLWFLLVVAAAVFTVYMVSAKGARNTVMKYTVLVLACACAISYNRGGNPLYADTKHMMSGSAVIDFLKSDEGLKNSRVLAPGIINQLDYNLKTEDLDSIFYYKRDSLFPNVPMFHSIANADGFDSLILGDFFRLKSALNALDAPWDHPAFSLLNVKYISGAPELKGKSIVKKFKGMTNLYEYADPSGPAYFIPSSAGWPVQGAVEKIGEAEVPLTSGKYMGKNPGKGIVFGRQSVNSFTAGLNAAEAGTLVISENYFPGWNAYEAGKKIKISRANVCFMAVSLSAGSHELVFKYEPVVFFVSSFISLLSLGFLIAGGIFISKKYKVKSKKD